MINVTPQLLAAKHTNRIGVAQLGQATVHAASAAFPVSVELLTKLVHRELTVGIGLEKADQLLTTRGLIGFSFRFDHSF